MLIIRSKEEWRKYVSGLDYLYLGPLEHHGDPPEKYPCKVTSEFLKESNSFQHRFVYAESVEICPACGQERTEWPRRA